MIVDVDGNLRGVQKTQFIIKFNIHCNDVAFIINHSQKHECNVTICGNRTAFYHSRQTCILLCIS